MERIKNVKMKYIIILVCLIFNFSTAVYSQNLSRYTDSIITAINEGIVEKARIFINLSEKEISKSENTKDTIYAKYLYAKGVYYSNDTVNISIGYLNEALTIWNNSEIKNKFKIMRIYFYLGKCYLKLAMENENKYYYKESFKNYKICYDINIKNHLQNNSNFSESLRKQFYISQKINEKTVSKNIAVEYIKKFRDKSIKEFDLDIIDIYRFVNDFENQEIFLDQVLVKYNEDKVNYPELLYQINVELVNNAISQKNKYGEIKDINKVIIKGENAYNIFKIYQFKKDLRLNLILQSLLVAYTSIKDNINADKYENIIKIYFPSNKELSKVEELKKLITLQDYQSFKQKFDTYESYLIVNENFNELEDIYTIAQNLFVKNILFKKNDIEKMMLYLDLNKSKLSKKKQMSFSLSLVEFYLNDPKYYLTALKLCDKYLDVEDILLRLEFYRFKSIFEEKLNINNAKNTRYRTLELARDVYGEDKPQLLNFYIDILAGNILANNDEENSIITSITKIIYENKLDSSEIAAKCWYYIGSKAIKENNYSKALIYLERCIANLEKRDNDHKTYSNLDTWYNLCLLELVTVCLHTEDYENVNIYLNDLKTYLDTIINADEIIKSGYYWSLGDLNYAKNNFIEAKKYYYQAQLLDNQNSMEFKIIKCDYMIYHNVEKTVESLNRFNKKYNTNIGSNYIYQLKYGIGDLKSSKILLSKNLDIIINSNSKYLHLLGDDEKYRIYKNNIQQFEFLNTYLLYDNNPEFIKKYLKYKFYTNSLLLNNSFNFNSSTKKNNELFNELKINTIQITKALENNEIDSISISYLKNRNDEIQRILSIDTKSMEATKNQTSINDKLYKNEAFVHIIRINKQKRNLELVRNSKVFTDSIFYGAIIIKKNIEPYFILIDSSGILENKINQLFRSNIQEKKIDSVSYHFLFEKIDSNLIGIEKIYLVNDGIYNSINIESVFNYKRKQYIFDYLKIEQIQNLKVFLSEKNELNKRKFLKANLFGNPNFNMEFNYSVKKNIIMEDSLTDRSLSTINNGNKIVPLIKTAEEIKAIKNILLNEQLNVISYTNDSANEDNLKIIKSPYILHIATHGFFISENEKSKTKQIISELYNEDYKDDPYLQSGLLFAGAQNSILGKNKGKNNNGIFTSFEAKNLDLSGTELVVLSACETGLGIGLIGEGVIGLPRAFMIAGAKNVVMSLWSVSDEKTKQLMIKFYTNYFTKKMNKEDALNYAKKEIKNLYPEPYYWAGFVLIK